MTSTIVNCYVTGSVTSTGSCSGGLFGEMYYTEVINCYSAVDVDGDSVVGGLAGKLVDSTITNSYSTGNVNGQATVSGLIGTIRDIEIMFGSVPINAFYNLDTVLINGESKITFGALEGTLYNDWMNNDFTLDIDDYLSNEGEHYLLSSISDLKKLLAFGLTGEYSFLLTNSIDLTEEPDFFLPFFSGSFEGGGHTISNLSLSGGPVLGNANGLFGEVRESYIANLLLEEVNISRGSYTGGLAGISYLTEIENVSVTGSIEGTLITGGLAGFTSGSTITNCSSSGNVAGSRFVGGLIGSQRDSSTLSYSYSACFVSGSMNITGGLVGQNSLSSTIENCYATGDVDGLEDVGGLAGKNVSQSIIIDSFSTGNVNGLAYLGGLVGNNGIAEISRCYSTGDVNGYDLLGGLVGVNASSATVSDSYSRGNVFGIAFVGGLIGSNADNSLIINSYSTGFVEGNSSTGGLIGTNVDNSAAEESYWNIETSGQETSVAGEGRTTLEMTYPYAGNTYVGWDFAEIWQADEDYLINDGYPHLGLTITSAEEEIIVTTAKRLTIYPNPFNPQTTIRLINFTTTPSGLGIYNPKGQRVKTVERISEDRNGYYYVWNGRNDNDLPVSSGLYFVVFRENGKVIATGKMLLLK